MVLGSSSPVLRSGRRYYAEVTESGWSTAEERDENVYLIADTGSPTASNAMDSVGADNSSKEVFAVSINNSVLAAVSPMLKDIMVKHQDKLDSQEDRFCYISTQLRLRDLQVFATFASTGLIDVSSDESDRKSLPLVDNHLIETFLSLGVDLRPLSLKLQLRPQSDQPFKPSVHKFKPPKQEEFVKSESKPSTGIQPSDISLKTEDLEISDTQILNEEELFVDNKPIAQPTIRRGTKRKAAQNLNLVDDISELWNEDSSSIFEDHENNQPMTPTNKRNKIRKTAETLNRSVDGDFWNDSNDMETEGFGPHEQKGEGDKSDEDKPLLKKPQKKRLSRKGNEVKGAQNQETSTGNFSGLQPWCSAEKMSEIKAELFSFPQDEGLRDPAMKFQCDRCVKGFKAKFKLEQHKRRHDAKSKNDLYFCLVCPEYLAFPSQSQLVLHMRSEVHSSQEKRKCPYCEKVFSSRGTSTHLQRHILNEHTKHKGPDLTTCFSCGKVSKTRKINNNHKTNMGKFHDGKCRICPDFESLLWSENLKHFNEVHDGEIQYKCGYCPKYFNTPQKVRIHVSDECAGEKNQHYERKNMMTTCDECGETVRKMALQQHKENHHGRDNVSCDRCGKTFKHRNVLLKHECGEKKVKYQCDQCEWMGTKSHLHYHKMAKHTPEHLRPYQCHICPKGFPMKKHLEMHLNVHLGIKPYQCKFCGMKFASEGNMHGHIRQTHKGIKRDTSQYSKKQSKIE